MSRSTIIQPPYIELTKNWSFLAGAPDPRYGFTQCKQLSAGLWDSVYIYVQLRSRVNKAIKNKKQEVRHRARARGGRTLEST